MAEEDLKVSYSNEFPEGESQEKILKELNERLKYKSFNGRGGRYDSFKRENGFLAEGRLMAGTWALYHYKLKVTVTGNRISMDCEFTRSAGAILGVWTFFLPLTFIPTFITGFFYPFFPILIPLQLFIIAFPFHRAKKNIVENKKIMEEMLSGLQHEVAKYNKPLIPRFYDNY